MTKPTEAIAERNQCHTTPIEPVLRWEELVDAIDNAGHGYSINLVRLVDGVATYELKYRGKITLHESYEDASDKLHELARQEKMAAAEQAVRDWLARAGLVRQGGEPVAKTYPRMTVAAGHKHICNLCHIDKNPADGCNCGADLIDLIRSEMMSDEHPISEWEVQFAEKIKALPMFAHPPASPTAELVEALKRISELCPVTCDMSLAHEMAAIADEALAKVQKP